MQIFDSQHSVAHATSIKNKSRNKHMYAATKKKCVEGDFQSMGRGLCSSVKPKMTWTIKKMLWQDQPC